MRDIHEVIVHCTATKPEWMEGRPTSEKVAEIRRWHVQDRGWRDIGYHFIIDRDGTTAEGRHIAQIGAHCRGHNTGTVGVALVGGHGSSASDVFSDNFTPEQSEALLALLTRLEGDYGAGRVTGHNEYAAKACPGFDVDRWFWKRVSRSVAPPVQEPATDVPPKPVAALATAAAAAGAAAAGWWSEILAFFGFGG